MKKELVIVLVCFLVVGGIILGAVVMYPGSKEDCPEYISLEDAENDPQGLRQYMATAEFGELPDSEKNEYLDLRMKNRGSFRRSDQREQMTDEQRQQYRKNMGSMMRQRMQQRMDDYFKSSPEEKTAKLDESIDRMQQRMKQWEQRRASGESERPRGERPRRGHGRGFSLDRLAERIENTPPEKRARFVQYMKDMQQRMKERGIDFGQFRGGHGLRR